jgi:hypothetical protein
MWRGLYRDHWLLGAHKDTVSGRKRLKPSNFRLFLRRSLSIVLVFALISLSFPIASLSFQDETSEPTYDELMKIFGEEDLSSLTVDDAAWDALLGIMKKWTDFLTRHAYDPTQHPWLNRLQTLGKLLSLRTLAQAGLVFSEGNGEEVDCSFLPPEAEHFSQVSQTLDEAAWDTLEQLILIGMAATGRKVLHLPAGNNYLVEVIGQSDGTGQEAGDDSDRYPNPIPEPGGGEILSNQSSRLYTAEWRVKDSEGNVLESASRLIDIALWIEPQALTSWDTLVPTPEEICDCGIDLRFGEEEDDGSYFADEYRFHLMAEGGFVICETDPQWYWFFVTVYTTAYRKGQPVGRGRTITAFQVPEDVWILGKWIRDRGALRRAIAANILRRWVWTTSREIKPDTHWVVELHFDDGSVRRVNAEARLEMESYHPYGVECYCPPYYPPIAISSIFLIGEIAPDKSGCPATPYVADGLKVTKWLDFAAETAMGFLLCGDVLVLIKRYWMEQEVGWVEWSSAVLSCIPVLGKIGGLALRGVAGAAKWFLRSRHLRHLAQGSRYLDDARRLHRRFAGWQTRSGGKEAHHIWPIYLGGDPGWRTVNMPRRKHRGGRNSLHSQMDEVYPRHKGRRHYCELYRTGSLTSQEIWQKLDNFYRQYDRGKYYQIWSDSFPEPPANLFIPNCQPCICGTR